MAHAGAALVGAQTVPNLSQGGAPSSLRRDMGVQTDALSLLELPLQWAVLVRQAAALSARMQHISAAHRRVHAAAGRGSDAGAPARHPGAHARCGQRTLRGCSDRTAAAAASTEAAIERTPCTQQEHLLTAVLLSLQRAASQTRQHKQRARRTGRALQRRCA
jgi:hypothetical protein